MKKSILILFCVFFSCTGNEDLKDKSIKYTVSQTQPSDKDLLADYIHYMDSMILGLTTLSEHIESNKGYVDSLDVLFCLSQRSFSSHLRYRNSDIKNFQNEQDSISHSFMDFVVRNFQATNLTSNCKPNNYDLLKKNKQYKEWLRFTIERCEDSKRFHKNIINN